MDKHLEYNTQREKLPLPEYGRGIQNMVDYALTIEDRHERQRCANTIINIMGNMFPHLRDVPDFNHKLWDHLAIMADYKLDIDYPYEISKQNGLNVKPEAMPYHNGPIRYRHYGHLIEELINQAAQMPDGPERRQLVRMIATHMKKDFIVWNKDTVDDQKIFDDIEEYSHGKIHISVNELQLMDNPTAPQQRNFTPRKRQSNNGQKRRC